MRLNPFRHEVDDATGLADPRPRTQPIETGTVRWLRSLPDALHAAGQSAKPVFALFQEVPGCAGCQQFGADVLSNTRIVDAIETEFVPLLIHNNTPGPDADVLATFGEPAWNYQVVRFLDASGTDVIERRDRVWDTGPLAARMIRTLETSSRDVPDYLRLVEQEHSDRLESVFLAQACFWIGEMEIGQIPGVVTTQAGFLDGHEVTKVAFDKAATSQDDVAKDAERRGVASRVFSSSRSADYRAAPASDQKRQLTGRRIASGLSPAQLTKFNAFVHTDLARANDYLSPSQRPYASTTESAQPSP